MIISNLIKAVLSKFYRFRHVEIQEVKIYVKFYVLLLLSFFIILYELYDVLLLLDVGVVIRLKKFI